MVYLVWQVNPESLEASLKGIFNSIGCARDNIIIEYFKYETQRLHHEEHEELMRHNKLTFGKFYYEISEEILQP